MPDKAPEGIEQVFPELYAKSEQELYEEQIRGKYRAVFTSSVGIEVLADLLAHCHFGSTLDPDNQAQIAEYNVGMVILARCKVLTSENYESFIKALFGLREKEPAEIHNTEVL